MIPTATSNTISVNPSFCGTSGSPSPGFRELEWICSVLFDGIHLAKCAPIEHADSPPLQSIGRLRRHKNPSVRFATFHGWSSHWTLRDVCAMNDEFGNARPQVVKKIEIVAPF